MKKFLLLLSLSLALSGPAHGAFPVVAGTNTSSSSARTNHTVNLPAGIASGDLLEVFFLVNGTPTITWPGGWTVQASITQGAGPNETFEIARRVADGTEGASITVTTNVNRAATHQSYRITGQHATNAPESATASGDSTAPDPPSLAPTWGAEDTLWLIAAGISQFDLTAITAYPANYANTLENGTFRGIGSARRTLNAASEDPGAYTLSVAEPWSTINIAIRPAAAGAACPKTLALMGVGC